MRLASGEMQMSDHGSFGVRRQVVAFHVGLGIAIHECAPARGVPATHAEVRIVVPLLPGVPSLTPRLTSFRPAGAESRHDSGRGPAVNVFMKSSRRPPSNNDGTSGRPRRASPTKDRNSVSLNFNIKILFLNPASERNYPKSVA